MGRWLATGLVLAWLAALPAPAAARLDEEPEPPDPPPAGAEDLLYLDGPLLSCYDVTSSLVAHLPRLIFAGQADSALGLVEVWAEVCPETDPHAGLAARLLVAIWTGGSADSLLPDRFIDHLVAALELEDDWCVRELDPPDSSAEEFCGFLGELAVALYEEAPPGSAESFLCRFYGGDRQGARRLLAQRRLPGTRLQALYDRAVRRAQRRIGFDVGISTDAWLPVGALSRLGEHPGVGLRLGVGRQPWAVHAEVVHRFGRAPEPWTVSDAGEWIETRRFVNSHFELQAAYRLLRARSASLDLLGGLGYAGLQFVPGGEDDSGRWLESLAWSAGLELRLPLPLSLSFAQHERRWFSYLGLQVRWEQTRWDTRGGTDLGGGGVVVRLLLGVFGTDRPHLLRALGQEDPR